MCPAVEPQTGFYQAQCSPAASPTRTVSVLCMFPEARTPVNTHTTTSNIQPKHTSTDIFTHQTLAKMYQLQTPKTLAHSTASTRTKTTTQKIASEHSESVDTNRYWTQCSVLISIKKTQYLCKLSVLEVQQREC